MYSPLHLFYFHTWNGEFRKIVSFPSPIQSGAIRNAERTKKNPCHASYFWRFILAEPKNCANWPWRVPDDRVELSLTKPPGDNLVRCHNNGAGSQRRDVCHSLIKICRATGHCSRVTTFSFYYQWQRMALSWSGNIMCCYHDAVTVDFAYNGRAYNGRSLLTDTIVRSRFL